MMKFFVRVAGVVLAAGCAGVLPQSIAVAATGNCPGGLIFTQTDFARGAAIGELVVYYDSSTGDNCAEVTHMGASVGHAERTDVSLVRCETTYPQPQCNGKNVPGGYAADGGQYSYYAGPVVVHAPANCVIAVGDLYWTDGWHTFNSGQIGC